MPPKYSDSMIVTALADQPRRVQQQIQNKLKRVYDGRQRMLERLNTAFNADISFGVEQNEDEQNNFSEVAVNDISIHMNDQVNADNTDDVPDPVDQNPPIDGNAAALPAANVDDNRLADNNDVAADGPDDVPVPVDQNIQIDGNAANGGRQKRARPFKCQWCRVSCCTDVALHKHYREYHSYKCEVCNRGFKSHNDMDWHFVIKHLDVPCRFCIMNCHHRR